jgi:hypothetical protein
MRVIHTMPYEALRTTNGASTANGQNLVPRCRSASDSQPARAYPSRVTTSSISTTATAGIIIATGSTTMPSGNSEIMTTRA